MYGEFSFTVKKPDKVLAALQTIFPGNDLANTLQSSQFANYPPGIFVFGVSQLDVHLLVGIADRTVTVGIDNYKNRNDLLQLKHRIDHYYQEMTQALRRQKIKSSANRAVITVEPAELIGTLPGRWHEIRTELTTNWKTLLAVPGLTLLAIFLLFHYGVISAKDRQDKAWDTAIATLPALAVFIISLLAMLLKKRRNTFNFTLP